MYSGYHYELLYISSSSPPTVTSHHIVTKCPTQYQNVPNQVMIMISSLTITFLCYYTTLSLSSSSEDKQKFQSVDTSYYKVLEMMKSLIMEDEYVTGFAKRYLFHTFDIQANKMM